MDQAQSHVWRANGLDSRSARSSVRVGIVDSTAGPPDKLESTTIDLNWHKAYSIALYLHPTMTSTYQLVVGTKGPAAALKAAWLRHNVERGHQVKNPISRTSPNLRLLSCCASAPSRGWAQWVKHPDACDAHIRLFGSEDQAEITSVQLQHKPNCTGARKRNYRTSDLETLHGALELYQPTDKREGCAKQYKKITKAATGVDITANQAHKAVR